MKRFIQLFYQSRWRLFLSNGFSLFHTSSLSAYRFRVLWLIAFECDQRFTVNIDVYISDILVPSVVDFTIRELGPV